MTLSGGQQVARRASTALYADADVTSSATSSAVDAHVGEHLFESAICAWSRAARRWSWRRTRCRWLCPRGQVVILTTDGT